MPEILAELLNATDDDQLWDLMRTRHRELTDAFAFQAPDVWGLYPPHSRSEQLSAQRLLVAVPKLWQGAIRTSRTSEVDGRKGPRDNEVYSLMSAITESCAWFIAGAAFTVSDGNRDRAASCFEESCRLFDDLQDPIGISLCKYVLANVVPGADERLTARWIRESRELLDFAATSPVDLMASYKTACQFIEAARPSLAPAELGNEESEHLVVERANELNEAGDLRGALSAYESAIDLNDQTTDALLGMARVCLDLGIPRASLECCNQALHIDSENAWVWATKARAEQDVGQQAESRDSVNKAIRYGDTADLFVWCGAIRQRQNLPDDAEWFFGRASEMERDNEAAVLNLALCPLVRAYLDDANDTSQWCKLTSKLPQETLQERANICFKRTTEIDAKFADGWINRGIACVKCFRWRDAERSLRIALDLTPEDAFAWQGLGSVFANTERKDEAVQCFQKVLEIDPNSRAAQQSLAILQSKRR